MDEPDVLAVLGDDVLPGTHPGPAETGTSVEFRQRALAQDPRLGRSQFGECRLDDGRGRVEGATAATNAKGGESAKPCHGVSPLGGWAAQADGRRNDEPDGRWCPAGGYGGAYMSLRGTGRS
jgi:hypothetical protein